MALYVEEVNPNLPVTYAKVLSDGTIVEYNDEPKVVRKIRPYSKTEIKKQSLNRVEHNNPRGEQKMVEITPSEWFKPITEPVANLIGVDPATFSDVAGPEIFAWLVQIPVNLFGRNVLGKKILYTILGGSLLAYASLAKPKGKSARDTLHLASHFLNYAADFNWLTINGIRADLEGIKAAASDGDWMGVIKGIFYTPEEVSKLAEGVKKSVEDLIGGNEKRTQNRKYNEQEDMLRREIERLRAELAQMRSMTAEDVDVEENAPEGEYDEEWRRLSA